MEEKKFNKYSIFAVAVVSIVSLILSLYVIGNFASLRNEVKALSNEINKINTDVEVFNQKSDGNNIDSNENITNDKSDILNKEKEISSFYENTTNDTINRINIAISTLCVVTAIFGLGGTYLTWVNLNIGDKIKSKLDKIDSITKDVESLNVIKQFIKGHNYQTSGKIEYAIEEYEEGLKYENSGILRIQLSGLYSDLYIETENSDFIEKALSYLEEECKECDKKLLSEYYNNKGCIYGLKGKMLKYNNENVEKVNNILNESIKWVEKAIELQPQDYGYYKNAALSYYYLEDEKNLIEYLKNAKAWANVNKMISPEKKDIFNVFQPDDLVNMTLEKWNKYRIEVGEKKESKEKFEQRSKGES